MRRIGVNEPTFVLQPHLEVVTLGRATESVKQLRGGLDTSVRNRNSFGCAKPILFQGL
jgi:hypothetical protein